MIYEKVKNIEKNDDAKLNKYGMTALSFLTFHILVMCLVCLNRFGLRESAKKMKDIFYERLLLI